VAGGNSNKENGPSGRSKRLKPYNRAITGLWMLLPHMAEEAGGLLAKGGISVGFSDEWACAKRKVF
jgi:hypothetical protein